MSFVKKVFDYFVWAMFVIFVLIAVLINVVNNIYPGNALYPYKLKFEGFVLASSGVLNKQVDVSIDLVSRRSDEVAKILASKHANEGLKQLSNQVELTAATITQIEDPGERKIAAEKYITKLNEVSSNLSNEQKDLVEQPSNLPTSMSQNPTPTPFPTVYIPTSVNNLPTTVPTSIPTFAPTLVPTTPPPLAATTVTEKIETTQETIKKTIVQMSEIKNQSNFRRNDQDQEKEKEREKNNNRDRRNNNEGKKD